MSNAIMKLMLSGDGGDSKKPLRFTALEAGSTLNITETGSVDTSYLVKRINGGSWTPAIGYGTVVLENEGDYVEYENRNPNNLSPSTSNSNYIKFVMTGKIDGSGNVMSLCNYSKIANDYAFYNLFNNCTALVSAPEIIADEFGIWAAHDMYCGCSNLTYAPDFPPAKMSYQSCWGTFASCASLVKAPELPSTDLADNCYESMFIDCTRLTTPPSILPTMDLSQYKNVYMGLFTRCSKLESLPELPATKMGYRSYYGMFQYCSALKLAPELPATDLADECYGRMFYYCSGLTTPPSILPAMNLSASCYKEMFYQCGSLQSIPELPATYINKGMTYHSMFAYCKKLTSVTLPEITFSITGTMSSMFNSCTQLKYIKVGFNFWTKFSGQNFTDGWVQSVSSSGTFEGPESLPLEFGPSRIPANWTVVGPKGINADNQTLYLWTGIEKENKIQYTAHTSNLKFEIVDGSLPTGLELTSDGKIKGTVNEELITHIDVKISTLDGSDIEKTITINIEVHEVNAYDPVFYFPCINDKIVYVKNGSGSSPLYFNQISTSGPITFSIDENGIYYLKIGSSASITSKIYTLQAQNTSSNKFFNGSKTDFTIFYKLKVNEMFTSGNRNLIEIYGGSNGKSLRIGIDYNSEGNFILPYIDNYNCGDNNTYTFGSKADRALNLSQWYDIVITYESATKTYKCYIDKVHKTTSISNLDVTPNVNYINIGSKTQELNWGKSIDSQLSDITIWTKVLTDDEIQSL